MVSLVEPDVLDGPHGHVPLLDHLVADVLEGSVYSIFSFWRDGWQVLLLIAMVIHVRHGDLGHLQCICELVAGVRHGLLRGVRHEGEGAPLGLGSV